MFPQAAIPPLCGEKGLAVVADPGWRPAGAAASGGAGALQMNRKRGRIFVMDTARWSKTTIAHLAIGAATESTTEAATGVAVRGVVRQAMAVAIDKDDKKRTSGLTTRI